MRTFQNARATSDLMQRSPYTPTLRRRSEKPSDGLLLVGMTAKRDAQTLLRASLLGPRSRKPDRVPEN